MPRHALTPNEQASSRGHNPDKELINATNRLLSRTRGLALVEVAKWGCKDVPHRSERDRSDFSRSLAAQRTPETVGAGRRGSGRIAFREYASRLSR
jgi:hypothetical protein